MTQRAGVALTELRVTHGLGWLFREQMESDLGTGAHLEVVEDETSTGRLLALQIKAEASYLQERTVDGIVYRPDDRHGRSHSLPAVIVLVVLDEETVNW